MHIPILPKNPPEDLGYTYGVTFVLGLSTLIGIRPVILRRLGDPTIAVSAFEHEDTISFIEYFNTLGARLTPSIFNRPWPEIESRIVRAGMLLVKDLYNQGIHCITPSSPQYPEILHDLKERKPNWLFLKGNIELLSCDSVAVVGTRNATHVGEFLTKYVVSICSQFSIPVVSGLARGIDTVAHEWALETNTPTISIMGSGILCPYPAKNIRLSQDIVNKNGLLVSEYPPYQEPSADMFVWRNRLQACLSRIVIAPEWKEKSGTAHTIRFAKELDRQSISLNLIGVKDHGDEGRGSLHLEIPTQHAFLDDLLRDIKKLSFEREVAEKDIIFQRFYQKNLFDGV